MSKSGTLVLATAVGAMGKGGVQRFGELAVRALVESSDGATIVSLHDEPGTELPGGVLVRGCGGSRARFVLLTIRAVLGGRPARLLVLHLGVAPVGRGCAVLARVPMTVVVHGVEAWRPLPWRTRWGAGQAHLLAVSDFSLRRLVEANPWAARLPAMVCHLAVTQAVASAREAEGRDDRVLCVGRLWGRGLAKGQDRVIRAWGRLGSVTTGWSVLIVGDGDGAPGLAALIDESGVRESVAIRGAVSDAELADLYAGSRVLAMPSEGEGFGLVIAEAMWHGLCCIVSATDAGAEVVRDGECGVVVDPSVPEELEQALRRLLEDPTELDRLARAGRELARTEYAFDAFVPRFLAAVGAPGR